MKPDYLKPIFLPFWLMLYSQPQCLAGLSPEHTHRQKNTVTPDVFSSWDWIEVLTKKSCLSGSISLCEL